MSHRPTNLPKNCAMSPNAAPDNNSTDRSSRPNLVGLDTARVLAMGMVVIQHASSLSGRDDLTAVAGLSIGQVGVAIFLVVSGLLSQESRREPISWLMQRFLRVYPAFWIAMIGSFCLASLSGYKAVSVGMIVSQMLGTGLWTHSGELVNSPTWFVSLILACYLATFLSRLIHRAGLVAAISAAALTWMVARDPAPWLLSHALTYAVASTIAAYAAGTTRRVVTVSAAAVLMMLAMLQQPAFAYTAIGLIIVELSLLLPYRSRIIKLAAEYSYEFYLLHGVALAGALGMMKHTPRLAVMAALISTAVAAVVLNNFAGFILRKLLPTTAVTRTIQTTNANLGFRSRFHALPPRSAHLELSEKCVSTGR
ncbi:MAG: acyltransferase family protein [Planctomycetota bacterium]